MEWASGLIARGLVDASWFLLLFVGHLSDVDPKRTAVYARDMHTAATLRVNPCR